MKLFESWGESLALLMPRQAKVMGLVTLKSMSDLFYNPFAVLVIVPLSVTIAFSMAYAYQPAYDSLRFISSILSNIFIVLMILYIRPSVMLKHRFYFMYYWRHIVYIAIFYGLISFIRIMWSIYFPELLWLIWAPLATFWVLFFVDSHVSIDAFVRSFIRAVKMVIYNLPVCLFLALIWYFCFVVFSIIPVKFLTAVFHVQSQMYFFIVASLLGIIFFPLWYCLMSNLYVKRLHDQFALYFGEPKN